MFNNQEVLLKKARQNKDAVQLPSDEVIIGRDAFLALMNKNGYALGDVNKDWIVENSQPYYDIVLEAVKQNGLALRYVNEEWVVANPQAYYDIVIAALTQNGLAFIYAGDVFRNNIKIVISLLMHLDRKCLESNSYILSISYKIDKMLSLTCEPRKDILLYVYMLHNKNVSNNSKNALFYFFIKKCQHALFDNFMLYKNILECYLTLSKGYTDAFPKYKLLDNLSEDDSKQLHMFLSVADPSALKNSQLSKLLNRNNHHNDIIKDYLAKDTYNLKCIKNFNIYFHLLPNNVFVVDYTKIINMMKNITLINKMKNDDLIKLVLCYFTIEDLLALYNDKLEVKLEVKYLNIDLEFHGPEGYISTGIQALFDAIKSNNGSLRNTGKYDTLNTIYNLLDIELSLYSNLIEVIE